jgi:hypothetical protein
MSKLARVLTTRGGRKVVCQTSGLVVRIKMALPHLAAPVNSRMNMHRVNGTRRAIGKTLSHRSETATSDLKIASDDDRTSERDVGHG